MNKTQYEYLKHSAKGKEWQKHSYTSKKIMPNGKIKYYYGDEPDNTNGGDKKVDFLSKMYKEASNNKYVNQVISGTTNAINELQATENTSSARAVTAMTDLAQKYANNGEYDKVYYLFSRYYNNLTDQEKKEIKTLSGTTSEGKIRIWAAKQIKHGKSIPYITAGCIYQMAYGEGIEILKTQYQNGQDKINSMLSKKNVQSARSNYYSKNKIKNVSSERWSRNGNK